MFEKERDNREKKHDSVVLLIYNVIGLHSIRNLTRGDLASNSDSLG
jgi:hypothetical protein